MIIPFQIFRFDRLDTHLPPEECFEAAIGITGDARFVGIWCQGRTLLWSDGRQTLHGDCRAWDLWHWSMGAKIFGRYCFGHRHREADHYLILDRVRRALYAAPPDQALVTLRQQFGDLAHLEVEVERDDALPVDHYSALWPVNKNQLHVERVNAGLAELRTWLRGHQAQTF